MNVWEWINDVVKGLKKLNDKIDRKCDDIYNQIYGYITNQNEGIQSQIDDLKKQIEELKKDNEKESQSTDDE